MVKHLTKDEKLVLMIVYENGAPMKLDAVCRAWVKSRDWCGNVIPFPRPIISNAVQRLRELGLLESAAFRLGG